MVETQREMAATLTVRVYLCYPVSKGVQKKWGSNFDISAVSIASSHYVSVGVDLSGEGKSEEEEKRPV